MATVNTFKDLEIWQLANEVEKELTAIILNTNLKTDIELRNQMNKSSGLVMDNIAEGFGRGDRLEFIQFLSIANASATELHSQIIRSFNRQYISESSCVELENKINLLGSKIGAFIKYLNSSTVEGTKFLNRNKSTSNAKLRTINTHNAAKPLGAYPHARKVGNLLFLSGIGSRRVEDNSIPGLELDENKEIIKYDIEAECHSVFENVKAVLEASGSQWKNMIDVTVFLTNMKQDFPMYNKIYAEYFKDVNACRTTVEVKSLPTPIAIELKVIATID